MEYELASRLRREAYYDPSAALRTQEFLEREMSEKSEILHAAAEMNKPLTDEEVSDGYRDLIHREFDEAKTLNELIY